VYVRWKKSVRFRGGEGRMDLAAVVVRSERVAGTPRQRVMCYLGAIDGAEVGKLAPRVRFWLGVDEKLAVLNPTPADRAKFEASIQAEVQRPTAEETAAVQREWEESERLFECRMAQLLGVVPRTPAI
jgi:hypothetical protein